MYRFRSTERLDVGAELQSNRSRISMNEVDGIKEVVIEIWREDTGSGDVIEQFNYSLKLPNDGGLPELTFSRDTGYILRGFFGPEQWVATNMSRTFSTGVISAPQKQKIQIEMGWGAKKTIVEVVIPLAKATSRHH